MSRDRRAGWLLSVLGALIVCFAIGASASCSSGGDDTSTGPDATQGDATPDGATSDARKDGVPPPGDAPPGDTVTKGPIIESFTATPPTLPAGGGSTTLAWKVTGATSLSIDGGVGAVTGTSHDVSVTTTTTFTLTATNADGSSTASVTVLVSGATGMDPPGGPRYAAMIAPVDGESFVGPNVDLRFVGVGRDENNYSGTGPGGGHSQAASVQFFVDGVSVLTVDAASSEYWVFKGYVKALALSVGDHSVFVRSFYTADPGPVGQADSRPITITVLAAPTYGTTVDMTKDLTLADTAGWVGTATSPIRVNGGGHRIVDAGSATPVNWQYVDFFDLGDRTDTSTTGIDVTTTHDVTIQNCRFDSSDVIKFSIGGTAAATVRGNLFRSNMRQPLGQLPYGDSYPTIQFTGSSTGAKTFSANNVGAGWVDFQAVDHWTVGGDTDDDGNVLIGPRVGIFFDYSGTDGSSTNLVVKRNYSDHVYYGGWSQGNNLEAGGNATLLAEDNILIGSSWTVRGMAGEFRDNLVMMGGEDWMWLDTNAYVHHNLFVGGDNNRGGLYNTYDNTGIRIFNNTFDGRDGTGGGVNAIYVTGSETVGSNLFVNLPYLSVDVHSGTLTADYDMFFHCASPEYSDSRAPAHDVHGDPLLTSPPTHAYEFDEKAVWLRTQKVHDILSAYRARYMPMTGSPAIDSGDPAPFGAGNDIGAIGNGTPNAADRFGL